MPAARSNRGRLLPDLLDTHRPDVKTCLAHADAVWAGSRQGLYRIGPETAEFLSDWKNQGEIMALGPAPGGLWVAHRKNGAWSLSRCTPDGRRGDPQPFAADEPTCLLEDRALWVGGKNNLYRRDGADWTPVLPRELAGHVDWLRAGDGDLWVALLKSGREKCPRLLRRSGAGWETAWTGTAGDRLRASDGRRHLCKWTADQRQPVPQAKPILAAAYFKDGSSGRIQASELILEDPHGREAFRLRDDRFSRGLWLARDRRRIVVAGEQGLHAVDLDSRRWTDLTAQGNGPRHAARIKHVWCTGPDRFLLCATHGVFFSGDGGRSWARATGEPDVFHARRLFRSADGSHLLATRDGVFRSIDGGRRWQALSWNGDGAAYDKLSGIARWRDHLVFGGKNGLWLQTPGAAPQPVEALAHRRIEDIVADGPRDLLVLCHGGEVFALDPEKGLAELLVRFPVQNGRAIVPDPGGLLLLGRKTLHVLGDDGPVPVPLPLLGTDFSFSVAAGRCVAFGTAGIWIAFCGEWTWRALANGPVCAAVPAGALAADGTYLLYTDGYRLRRLDIAPETD